MKQVVKGILLLVSVVIKVGNTQIYLTDLTKDTAHWHFIDDFYSDNISDKCKMQILPYRLVKR